MLDSWTSKQIRQPLAWMAGILQQRGVSADTVTLIGFGAGLAAIPLLWGRFYGTALVLILLNRLLDGLDGALARLAGTTDAGGFLDIVCDFIFYSAIPFGFALADPAHNALAAAGLIFAFIGTGVSFLAFAVMAAKHDLKSQTYPHKSLYYLGGLTEGTETVLLFVLMCLFPSYFRWLAAIFALLCRITTTVRLYSGFRMLKQLT